MSGPAKIFLEVTAMEMSVLLHLLQAHIGSGEYWGGKNSHYKTCDNLYNRMTGAVTK